jgi:hypothetical protein
LEKQQQRQEEREARREMERFAMWIYIYVCVL